MTHSQRLTLDGVTYHMADLTEEARVQVEHFEFSDRDIARLKSRPALLQTARAATLGILKAELMLLENTD